MCSHLVFTFLQPRSYMQAMVMLKLRCLLVRSDLISRFPGYGSAQKHVDSIVGEGVVGKPVCPASGKQFSVISRMPCRLRAVYAWQDMLFHRRGFSQLQLKPGQELVDTNAVRDLAEKFPGDLTSHPTSKFVGQWTYKMINGCGRK